MYPNAQDALPLPPRPNLEQYKKQAKDLAAACKSGNPDGFRSWAVDWLNTLANLEGGSRTSGAETREWVERAAAQVAGFARAKLSADHDSRRTCRLTDAQFILARAHGFTSWVRLARHLESLAQASSPVSRFESAADAIVRGDGASLERLLREQPDLVRERSTREHNATLLHYVSANGVEGYRQKSPANAATIARILLDAGAEVDARADVYGSGCTTLGLVATSAPPAIAGVQQDVMAVLLEHGARMDAAGLAGHDHSLVRACLANGQPDAAQYLVARGAPLDLPGAAGVGRVDALAGFFDNDGRLIRGLGEAQLADSFALACAYGRATAVEFFLDRRVDADLPLRFQGAGHTGLHVAAYYGHVEVVRALLRHGARVEVADKTWGTPPLTWALTGWGEKWQDDERYYDVVAALVRAGAHVGPDLLAWDRVQADPKMLAALSA